MLKGAIIGFGKDAADALPAALSAAKDLRILAVCEKDPALLAGAGGPLPEAALYGNTGDLFSKSGELDFVILRGAAEERFGTVRRALENRLHVICETPFCSSTREFEELREAAAKAGRVLSALQPWERGAHWLALQRTLNGGLLGSVTHAEVQFFLPGPCPDGGVTAAYGWKAFAMLLAAVRLPPLALSARLTPAPEPGAAPAEGAAAFQVHFGGADGSVYLCSGAHAARFRLAASGEKGRAELDGDLLRLDVKGLAPETIKLGSSLAAGDRPEWLGAELSAFAEEIKGKSPAGSGLRNSRYCVKLLKNAYYSASLRSSAVPL
jgi:predicted dehydrogenase